MNHTKTDELVKINKERVDHFMEWNELKKSFTSLDDADIAVTKVVMAIFERRKELGYSQRDLAKIVGMKQSAIARIESLAVVPKLDTVYRLCEALDLKIELNKK